MSEELLAASKERIADLLEPIGGGVGEDISYDEQFEEIKNETEKLASLTGESCDWSSIAVTSEEILQEKSKDFRVACYLGTCKAREGTLEGVLDGILLLQEMSNKFWDEMFPPLRRIRARAGMVGWFSDQSGPVASEIKLKASDGPMVKAIDEASVALDADYREKFGDHYTGISQLREASRFLTRTCPKEKPKPEPEKPAPVEQAAPAAAAPAAVAAPAGGGGGGPSASEISTAQEAERALEPTGLLLVRIGGAMRAEKPENEFAYRLARMGMWLEVTSAPTTEDGKSLVPPPPAHLSQRLDSLAASQDWLTLLNEAEEAAAEYILWLDPHRHASTAMSALGALFMKAKQELLTAVALHLKRVPTMPTVQFNDGTPFADGQTAMWIESEVTPVLGGDGDGGGGGGGGPSVLDEPLKEARELAVKGDLGKAIDVVGEAAAAAPSPLERFRGKLAIAQLCLGAGQFSIARGQLDGLTAIIEQHQLTAWDPNLCAEVYGALYSSIKGANEAKASAAGPTGAPVMPGQEGIELVSAEDLAAEEAAFERLCQLDPAQALKLRGDKKKG